MPFTVGQYLTANDLKSQEDAHTLGYGVVNGLQVIPKDPASMDVQVETGKAYVADTLVEKGAATDLTVGAADPTNPRKDIVVCNSAGTLSIVAGTPEAALPSGNVGVYTLNPEPPSIPANSIILGEIWVAAGATEITGSEIYDKRVSIADFIGHKADASAHHAKYTNAEAVAAAEAAGLALASGKNIKLISALSANDTWSGLSAVLTAGEVLALGNAVYLKAADSEVYKALATATTTMPGIALATCATTDGNAFEFLLRGFMRHDAWDWTPGGLLYIDRTTAGALTQTAPSTAGDQVQVVGVAITADIIFFNPSFELVEIS